MLTTTVIAQRLTDLIINPLIALAFAAGLLIFFWGVIEFLMALNSWGSADKGQGKQHMLWGLIGMFVMVAAYALFNFLVANICGSLSACYSGANL